MAGNSRAVQRGIRQVEEAAFDLLAACQMLVASYEEDDRGGKYALGELYQARMAATAAIAKALGAQS